MTTTDLHRMQDGLATARAEPGYRPGSGSGCCGHHARPRSCASAVGACSGRRTNSVAEAGGGAARHMRKWSVGASAVVADFRRLRLRRGASRCRPSVDCGKAGPSLSRPRPLNSGQRRPMSTTRRPSPPFLSSENTGHRDPGKTQGKKTGLDREGSTDLCARWRGRAWHTRHWPRCRGGRGRWTQQKRIAALKAAKRGERWMGIAKAAAMPFEELRKLREADPLFNQLLLAAREAAGRGEDIRL